MSFKFAVLISLLVLESVLYVSCQECQSPKDCGPDHCCAVGWQRYSIPSCRKLGKSGDWCYEGAEPEDLELHYPNAVKYVFGVYRMMCPCEEGLQCKYGNKCVED